MIDVRKDDVTGKDVLDLLQSHLDHMRANSPPESVFALKPNGLRQDDVTVWTAWIGNEIAGVGALKQHGADLGEIKSMRTHSDHLRKGVGARLLDHIIEVARTRGLKRLSLETGSSPAFEPALSLYERWGFVEGDAFADYVPNPFSRFYHMDL